jgi:hypothetical protein
LAHAVQAFGEAEVKVLLTGDIGIAGQFLGGAGGGIRGEVGTVQTGHEETSLHAGGSTERLLGDGNLFKGEEFQGIGGRWAAIFLLETGDFIEVFQNKDAKGSGGEAMLACVLGGAGFS